MAGRKILSPEQEALVVRRYSFGESALAISRTMNASVQTIHNTLRRCGVSTRPELTKRRLTPEQRSLIVETCLGGVTATETAKIVGVSVESILRVLKSQNIRLPKGRPRVHETDDGAFDTLTAESLYWMGFLFADGCISEDDSGSPRLICALAEKDTAHLTKLQTFLRTTNPISKTDRTATSKGGPFARLSVRSKQLCAALKSHGFTTKRQRSPSDRLVRSRDFWRGCVDGDGAVGSNFQKGHWYAAVRLAGQPPVLSAFQRFLTLNGLACPAIVPAGEKTGSVMEIETTGSTALAIIDTLYRNAPPTAVLERKNARAQAMLSGRIEQFASYD